jgi:hypothetical protein
METWGHALTCPRCVGASGQAEASSGSPGCRTRARGAEPPQRPQKRAVLAMRA